MAYIANIFVSNNWAKLEDLIKTQLPTFAFKSNVQYTIQNKNNTALIAESSTIPQDEIGFIKEANEKPLYYKKGSCDLYVKALKFGTYFSIGDEN